MLNIVESLVCSPCISFGEYFQAHVCNLQDTAIDQELRLFARRTILDVPTLAKLIEEEIRRCEIDKLCRYSTMLQ